MKKILLAIAILVLSTSMLQAQILYLTISSISKSTKSADKKLMANLKGSWIITRAEIAGEDVSPEFDGVIITFPKCKGKEVSAESCEVEVRNDDNTDYFKSLFADDPTLAITSRKEINKASKAEDAEFEKVKYEIVQTAGSEYEFSFKYKKKTVKIQTIGERGDEYFEMTKAPKEKKKK